MLSTASSRAEDLVPSRLYAGAAFTWVHHTGYVPGAVTQADVAQYAIGGKAFVGFRAHEYVQFEAAYHYLGQVQVEGLPYPSDERSYAFSGSAVHVSQPLSRWLGSGFQSIHGLLRLGLAYKNISQTLPNETVREGILSGVIGAGFEFRLSPTFFARIEYEFLSTAIGGKTQSIPALNSSFDLRIGGTQRVVNVMHTPLALTLGANF
jgi:hypothetical protein